MITIVYIYGLACNWWFYQQVLLVITAAIKERAFTIAEGCTSGSSTVAFVPSCIYARCSHECQAPYKVKQLNHVSGGFCWTVDVLGHWRRR